MNADIPAAPNSRLLEHATVIVCAYQSQNPVSAEQLPTLIQTVFATCRDLGHGVATAPVEVEQVPAVPIGESVFPDYIVCLEDGKKRSMLKRHLKTSFNMTPEDYREKWKLPHDYPLTAPNYSKRRSALTKAGWIGRTRRLIHRRFGAAGASGGVARHDAACSP